MISDKMVRYMNKFRDDCADLYRRKNHDYGNSAHETYCLFGDTSYIVRLHDKTLRVKTLLAKGSKVSSESIFDTLTDLYCYACMWEASRENVDAEMVIRTSNRPNADVIKSLSSICSRNMNELIGDMFSSDSYFIEGCNNIQPVLVQSVIDKALQMIYVYAEEHNLAK